MDVQALGTHVAFDGQTVTIQRVSGIAKAVFGESSVTIPVRQITAIDWRAPKWHRAGHIRFAVPGTQASAFKTPVNRDPNAVLFGKKQRKDFEALRAAIEAAVSP